MEQRHELHRSAGEQLNFVTVEAGHSDVNTAYVRRESRLSAAAAAPPAPEQHYIYRTHDGGKTWTRIVNGLPTDERTGSQVHVIREDPKQKGLLFAGTETTVYVSFDDGDHWQSLRLNLPSTSIRDMVFHTDDHMNDLVICTYGRGFWVLDDMSPLREVAAKAQAIASAPAYLFKPGDAIRSRMNANWDQPMNPEMPHAENPPFGALLYYHLSKKPAGEIKLQIFDSAGKLVRTITSIAAADVRAAAVSRLLADAPEERALSTNVGTNRINWDLRYDDPPGYNPDINNQMNASPGSGHAGAARAARAAGHVHGQAARSTARHTRKRSSCTTIRASARVSDDWRSARAEQTGDGGVEGMKDSYAANEEVAAVRAQLAALTKGSLPSDVQTAATALDAKLATLGAADGAATRWRIWRRIRRPARAAGQRASLLLDQRLFTTPFSARSRRTASTCRRQARCRHMGIRLQGVYRDGPVAGRRCLTGTSSTSTACSRRTT